MLNFGFMLEAANTGSWWVYLIIFGLLIVFLVFSNSKSKKQERQEAEMRDNIQAGDEVTTIGGIVGMVVSVKGETFVLETTKEKTKIRFLKGAIRSVDVKAADKALAVMNKDAKAEGENEAVEAETAAEETTEETK